MKYYRVRQKNLMILKMMLLFWDRTTIFVLLFFLKKKEMGIYFDVWFFEHNYYESFVEENEKDLYFWYTRQYTAWKCCHDFLKQIQMTYCTNLLNDHHLLLI